MNEQNEIIRTIFASSCTPANDLWTYVQKKRITKKAAEAAWSNRHPGETLEQGVQWENDFMRDNDI